MAETWETNLNQVLMQFGITKSPFQENAAEELESILQDYHDLAHQHSKMLADFCYEEKPVSRNGIWLCPKCGKRTQYNHTHCHWCGKKMGWKEV